MSKRAYISRYLLILKRIKSMSYPTMQDIQDYIDRQLEFLQMNDEDMNMGLSTRTLQRDFKEIRNLFGVQIEYSKKEKGYFIEEDTVYSNLNFERMMESFDVFNSLNLAQDFQQYIHLENRKPQGTLFLPELIYAIKNRFKLSIVYHKFYEDAPQTRVVAPYALKEFKNRWYLITNNETNNSIRTFALDRIQNIELSKEHFQYPKQFDVSQYFQHIFGITNPDNAKPSDIIISIQPGEAKYILTLPFHHSQKTIVENEDEVQISLHIVITHEFIMELLSYGDNVKVLQPISLATTLKNILQSAANQYDTAL